MSDFQLVNAHPETSHFEMQAGALALEASRVLSRRNPGAPGKAIEIMLGLISVSGLARAAAIWSERKGEDPDDKGFGHADNPNEYTVGAYEDNYVLVCVGLVAKDTDASESFQLLAELLAQLLGRFLAAEHLRQDNESAQKQLYLDREALQLRKTMERARALLARYGTMTSVEATDYLMSVSVRTGRPLLEVANRIVLAYSGPETGFRWPDCPATPLAIRHAVATPPL